MRPRARLPANERDTSDLVEQVRQWITALGFPWSGPGGAFLIEDPTGPTCWRVYSEWAGTGVTADVDAQSGELLVVADVSYESVGEPLQLPPNLMATAHEAASFVRARLAQIGWAVPEHFRTTWDQGSQSWRLDAPLEDGAILEAEVAGKKGSLRLVRATTKQERAHT